MVGLRSEYHPAIDQHWTLVNLCIVCRRSCAVGVFALDVYHIWRVGLRTVSISAESVVLFWLFGIDLEGLRF